LNRSRVANRRHNVWAKILIEQKPRIFAGQPFGNFRERKGPSLVQRLRVNSEQSRSLRSVQVETTRVLARQNTEWDELYIREGRSIQVVEIASAFRIQVVHHRKRTLRQ